MKRRDFILTSLASTALAAPALSQSSKLSLGQLETYMNGLKNLQARFTQINNDGSSVQGDLYIARPFRMRFEYDPPSKSMVIAKSSSIAVIDGKSNSGPQIYPLRKTPLYLILANEIQLFKQGRITAHFQVGELTAIDAIDPKEPSLGTMRIFFRNDPIQIAQWIVTDRSGQRTTVILNDITIPEKVNYDLFEIPNRD